MAGEGFSKHASTSLRENRNLRRKKSMFKKERTFLNQKSSDIKTDSGHIPYKKPSKYLLSKIKEETFDRRKKETITILWVVLISFLLFWIIGNYVFQREKRMSARILNNAQKEELQKKAERYQYLISSGDDWYDAKKYYNAAFQYRLALELFPNDSIALYRLISAYDSNCIVDKRNCGKSEKLLENFMNR